MRNYLFQVAVASAAGAFGIAGFTHAAFGQTDDLRSRVQALEQDLKILQRQIELQNQASTGHAKDTPVLSAGASGFSLRSADTNFVLKLRGYLQADSRWFLNDHAAGTANDTFLLRRVRPILEGTVWDKYDFRIMLDFGSGANASPNNNAYLQEAYFTARWLPELQLTGGKMKEPVSLERLQSGANLLFVERGYTAQLAPNRDVGFMFQGNLFGTVNYQVGAFNGVANGGSADVESADDEKDVVARLFAHPFRKAQIEPLKELGIGIAATYGNQEGALRSLVSPGQQRVFEYNPGTVADGNHWRLAPQGYLYWGAFGIFGEHIISHQEVVNGADRARLGHAAWQVAASYVLTGEKNSWRGITPKRPFSLKDGGWGAFEISGRFQHLDLDDNSFPAFASPSANATEAESWGWGLNWHLNRNFKLQLNYDKTRFKARGSEFLRAGEQILFTRAQLSF